MAKNQKSYTPVSKFCDVLISVLALLQATNDMHMPNVRTEHKILSLIIFYSYSVISILFIK